MHSHRIIVKTAAAVLLALAAVSSLPALSPTLVAGVFAESVPKEAPEFGIGGSLGYRFPVGDDGYALINAATYLTELRSAAESGEVPFDYSRAELITSLPAGRNRVEISGSAGASLLGAAEEELYFDPDWEVRYSFERGRRKVRPYIAYAGAFRYEESGTGGYFSSGAKAGFVYSPEVEIRWDLQTGAYLEQYEDRQDLLLDASLSLDLLPGLFREILLEPSVSWRSSDSSAESAIGAKLPAALRWTPVKEWSFQLDGSAGQVYYPEAEESTFTGLASLRIDRTIRDSFFLYLEGGGGNNIDPYLRAGIDVSF
jgi:hypothetical protein